MCLGDSGVSVSYFVAAFSSVFVGIFRVVVSRFFPLGIPKVQRIANLVDVFLNPPTLAIVALHTDENELRKA